MEPSRALTANGRAARATAAKWKCERLGLTKTLYAKAAAGTATSEVN
jgi:hypothetical protein